MKRVLILHSEDMDNVGQQLIEQGIRKVLLANRRFDITLFKEHLDVSRFGTPAFAAAMSDFLSRKYSGIEIDAVIAVYPRAVNFLLAERTSLFAKVPVVAVAVTRGYAEYLESLPARSFVTGTVVGEKLTSLMDEALLLKPRTRNVALVAGTSENDLYSEEGYRKGLALYADKIGLIDLTKLSMEETLSRVSSLPKDTLVFYSSMFKDAAGKIFSPREALSRISAASSVPVFGVQETYLGYGIVGGYLLSFTEHGKEAAAIALKIMEGQSPGTVPFGGEMAYITAYDWRELRRWDIPETAVKAGAEIRFRIPSFWEAHRYAIIGAMTLIVLESLLVLGLLINFLKRRKAESSLFESEQRLAMAADSAGAGLWSLNLGDKIYWLTDKTRELYGLPPDGEVTFDRLLQIVHPDDRERFRRRVEAMTLTKEEGGTEYRIILTDGNIRWIVSQGHAHLAESGVPDRLMGISLDITQRKFMEEDLQNKLQEIKNLKQQLEKENIYLKDEIVTSFPNETIIGKSEPIQRVLSAAEQVAQTDSTVLITGETGTGKELLARFIHNQSKRRDRAMVRVNCGALPPTLIESELFGREKGAYTGAMSRESGRFEVADGSTLFLDEIGELQADLQAKLLHFLETGEFERLGSSKTIKVDVRVIAATNRNLLEEVKKGNFREDLYYRLNVFPIEVPPLRQRPEDIPILVQVFIKEFNKQIGRKVQSVSKKAMSMLQQYEWPGNIRELRNVIEHAVILSRGDTLHLEMEDKLAGASSRMPSLEDSEKQLILNTLEKTEWRIKGTNGAAEILKLKPSTLYSKMEKLGIPSRRSRGKKDDIPT